jgi:hypothetical protein
VAVAKAARFRLSQLAAVVVVGAMLRVVLALARPTAREDCRPEQAPALAVKELPASRPPRPRMTVGKVAVVAVVPRPHRLASGAAAPCGAAVVVDVAGIEAQLLQP